jgi:lipoyl(octanoyl) transferase
MDHHFRIIHDCARNAAFNMAADRYLLERAAKENTVFLRIYGWAPPAISLGLLQPPGEILDKDKIAAAGVDYAVRPTGGRAVLHWNDLTYSIAFPHSAPSMGKTISESYAIISRCLRRGLEMAGIQSMTHDSAGEYAATKRVQKLPCFLSPNRNEIMVQGKKLIGSAQKRTNAAILQHGSIPLDGSFRRLPEFLLLPEEEKAMQRILLEKKCVCIHEIDPSINFEKLRTCLIKGFVEILPFSPVEIPWSAEEVTAISNISK